MLMVIHYRRLVRSMYLYCGALVRKWTVKERVDDSHHAVGHIVLHCDVSVFAVMSHVCYHAHVHQEALLE